MKKIKHNWTPEFAIDNLTSRNGYDPTAEEKLGYFLSEKFKLDEEIKENLVELYIKNKRLEFLKKATIDDAEEYFEKYFIENKWLIAEAKEKSVIEDSIDDDVLISYLLHKYNVGIEKMHILKEIKDLIKLLK